MAKALSKRRAGRKTDNKRSGSIFAPTNKIISEYEYNINFMV